MGAICCATFLRRGAGAKIDAENSLLFSSLRTTPRTALKTASLIASILAAALSAALPSVAEDEAAITISIKDHKFEPAEIKVPSGKAIKLTVNNLDATPEEFESKALKVEKVIAANQSAVVRLKPLAKGTYHFVGEYHEDTAKGTVVAE